MKISTLINKATERIQSFFAYLIARLLTASKGLVKNKFFCISMTGNSYGDNIKCLSDFIEKNDEEAEIVWAFSSSFKKKSGCQHKSVELYSVAYYKEMLTSKYILSNARLNQRMFHKRKGQIYLQTWHGTALKIIGIDARKPRPGYKKLIQPPMLEFDVDHTDIMISGSGFMTNIYREKFGFKGDMWEVGTPRNDIFFGNHPELVEKVHRYYNIPKDSDIILYAPTFRSDGSLKYYDIDAKKLLSLWENKIGRKCVFLARLHPNIASKESELKKMFPANTIYASSYPDMQELLYATDLLVTDYSSSMFDFMYSGKPVLMYVPDWDSYDRGFYFKKEDIPFIMIEKNEDLQKAINEIESEATQMKRNAFIENIKSFEEGNASYKIIKKLYEH